MFESGLVDEWKMRTWMRMKTESNEGPTELDNVRTTEALHLDDLQSVFFIYGFFIAVSVLTYLIEVSCKHSSQKSEEMPQNAW